MSKAFTSEEAPDDPILVPPRAPLPEGVPNYVTARGLRLLRDELASLETERARVAAEDTADVTARTRRLAILGGRLAGVAERLATARLVEHGDPPPGEARFGATVGLAGDSGARAITIVGVDEADPATGRVAFVAPIAKAVLGLEPGDVATLRLPHGEEELEITSVEYARD